MITNTTMARLPQVERDELQEIVAEARGKKTTPRFHNDFDEPGAFYLLFFVAGLGGIGFFLYSFDLDYLTAFWQQLTAAPALAMRRVEVLGFHVAVVAAGWFGYKLATTWRRHGWAVASFGFVRVRGKKLRLVRWRDITRVVRTRGRRYSHIEIATRDGSVLGSYAGSLYGALCERLPPGVTAGE